MLSPDLEAYLTELVRRLTAVLGGDLEAVYVGGSVALGDYRTGHSDLDVFAASARALAAEDKRRVLEAIDNAALPCPSRGLEFVLYRVSELTSGAPCPSYEVELNDGPHMRRQAHMSLEDRPASDGRFWYGIDLAITAQAGRALLGPPPAELVRPAPRAVLLDLLAESVRWHLESDGVLADDAVLNACRALCFVREGRWSSKSRGGEELRELDPVVVQALRKRTDEAAAPPSSGDVRTFLERALLEAEQRPTT